MINYVKISKYDNKKYERNIVLIKISKGLLLSLLNHNCASLESKSGTAWGLLPLISKAYGACKVYLFNIDVWKRNQFYINSLLHLLTK